MVCGAVCDNNISILCIVSLLAAASYITHRICDWGSCADITQDKPQLHALVGFSSSQCCHGNKEIY